MFPDWYFYVGGFLLFIVEIVLVAALWKIFREKKEDITKYLNLNRDKRWPQEPCGRSLEQCPYNKMEHLDYFNAHKNQQPWDDGHGDSWPPTY